VLRIATHEAVRSRGLGSRLLGAIRERSTADWLGVGFGATPRLVEFWRANGLNAVHLSTSRDDRSGEHSAVMLEALTDAGEALLDRHGAWFRRRLPGTLADSLSTLDPDVVRAVCRAAPGTLEPNLTQLEWRLVAGIPHGAAIHGTAPRPVRRLTLGYLLADGSELSTRQERLLVTRTLQCRNWEAVAQQLAYGSRTECMRALGDVVETLVERYGTDQARAQLERLG
jgi:tRNA(Met) cytidine acetyltransferase